MNEKIFPLSMAMPGKNVILAAINGGRGLRARLMDMGLQDGIEIHVLQSRRVGPCVIMAGGTRLVLGHGVAQKVLVRECRK